MAYNTLKFETSGAVGILTLDRPKAMNALNAELISELHTAVDDYEANERLGCLVITGNEKAFAAGADIKAMVEWNYIDMLMDDIFRSVDRVAAAQKPIIAAVAGYALGGGCELAMACDFIIAADTAKFGQPEINIGVMPGAGGTQRLTQLVGKSKAMDMCLTGRMMDADEALSSGLVARIVPANDLMEETLAIAKKIAESSRPAVMMTKAAVNRSLEVPLAQGIATERVTFQSLFTTEDQKEGMLAFVEKRSPQFRNR